MKLRLLFFDWDNTLVDTWRGIHAAMMQTFDSLNMTRLWEDLATTKKNGQLSLRDSFPKIFGTRYEEAKKNYYQIYQTLHLEFLNPIEHAENLLQTLANANLPIGVISNKTHNFLLKEIEHLGWQKYFQMVVGAGHAVNDKPSSGPLDKALTNLYVDKKKIPEKKSIWYVGDMNVDAEFANNTGIVAAMVPSEPIILPHDYNFTNLQDLEKEIKSLLKSKFI